MAQLENELKNIAQKIKNGAKPPEISVSRLLSWHGASRRGNNVNWQIRHALNQAGLETQPDFETAYIYGSIKFVAIGSEEDRESKTTIYRIDILDSANQKPVSIKPDSLLNEAVTIMLHHDFSQLPVMTNERDVKGAISWKSIGSRLAFGKSYKNVREFMDPIKIAPKIVESETSLFEAIILITEHDYVLVKAQDQTICGIVTASDLSKQFRELAEPFLLIGECENLLRRLIHGKFNEDDLKKAQDPSDTDRAVTCIADLTFGEYIRLLEEPSRWSALRLQVDRNEFIAWLNRVREIRNDIMHFDPQGTDPEILKVLRGFTGFLLELRRLDVI